MRDFLPDEDGLPSDFEPQETVWKRGSARGERAFHMQMKLGRRVTCKLRTKSSASAEEGRKN